MVRGQEVGLEIGGILEKKIQEKNSQRKNSGLQNVIVFMF